ncbi:hypothetical protein P872_01135 [Rhodonellum psychrophilum GCM71 = DSM 17998]|uniref:Uncharacterized protein n=1 Tax=Rhodonellum psychrophilum GCM71 = DSM 17998 TaxID=1123057 RepID=U5C6T7_9BACT|nr:hypothetical protein P872_01135 [Rhodonellum psychrophilum GCM71 = DSM 17998]
MVSNTSPNIQYSGWFISNEKATPPHKNLCRLPKTFCLAEEMGEELGSRKILFEKMFWSKKIDLDHYR